MGAMTVTTGQVAQTTATRVGSTQRAIAGSTEDAGFFARVGRQIAEWLGMEGAKTAGTVAEAGARGTAETAAATAAMIAAKAQAAAEIPAYAGIGAAAAMASVAAIPVVGWAMAPAVGAEHAATAMAYLGMASAEGGWGEVPADGVRTELHKQEMVLPAKFATPLRSLLTNDAAISALSGGGLSLGMPQTGRFALPDWLGKGPNFPSPQHTVSTTTSKGGDRIVKIGSISASSPVNRATIMDLKDAVCEAVAAGMKNGNQNALYIARKKG